MTKANYSEIREKIVSENENLVGIVLREEERKLDRELTALKRQFSYDCYGNVPYDMPVLRDPRIRDSALYDFCHRLPKGSDLHVHGSSMVPARRLIDFLYDREDVLIDPDSLVLRLPEDEGAKNCLTVKEALDKGRVLREALLEKWTVIGGEKADNIWEYFEKLFDYVEALDRDYGILYDYYVFAFREYLSCGIFHPEIHILMSTSEDTTFKTIETVRKAYYTVKKEDCRLVVSVIGASMKQFDTFEDTRAIFENTLRAQKTYKDESEPGNPRNLVLGFDLINEEDSSRPLAEYAGLLLDFKSKNPDFKYFIHCGESLSPESDNLIDAYLIGAERVGHGMNLYRYPGLLKKYADEEICLESCVISNQTLRYTQDVRLHPGAEYLRRGVAVALCSDDPVFQENEALTDDFFAATVSWNLSLADIKQLCLNSIYYSGLDESGRRNLMKNWSEAWNSFVTESLRKLEN